MFIQLLMVGAQKFLRICCSPSVGWLKNPPRAKAADLSKPRFARCVPHEPRVFYLPVISKYWHWLALVPRNETSIGSICVLADLLAQ